MILSALAKMGKLTATLFWALMLFEGDAVYAQSRQPIENELKAAYCIPVIQEDIEFYTRVQNNLRFPPPQFLERMEDPEKEKIIRALAALVQSKVKPPDFSKTISDREVTIKRLRDYLEPRTPQLDASALTKATNDAESDLQEWRRLSTQCDIDCGYTESGNMRGNSAACLRSCMSVEINDRFNSCRNLEWLPSL